MSLIEIVSLQLALVFQMATVFDLGGQIRHQSSQFHMNVSVKFWRYACNNFHKIGYVYEYYLLLVYGQYFVSTVISYTGILLGRCYDFPSPEILETVLLNLFPIVTNIIQSR
jgi:hypothetical protein